MKRGLSAIFTKFRAFEFRALEKSEYKLGRHRQTPLGLLLAWSKGVPVCRGSYKYLLEVLVILELRYCLMEFKQPKRIITIVNPFYFIIIIMIIFKIFTCAGVLGGLSAMLCGSYI